MTMTARRCRNLYIRDLLVKIVLKSDGVQHYSYVYVGDTVSGLL